jgi:hypothetical protein
VLGATLAPSAQNISVTVNFLKKYKSLNYFFQQGKVTAVITL